MAAIGKLQRYRSKPERNLLKIYRRKNPNEKVETRREKITCTREISEPRLIYDKNPKRIGAKINVKDEKTWRFPYPAEGRNE